MYNYIYGIGLPGKACWKSIVSEYIKAHELCQIIDDLHMKNDVYRYLEVYQGEKHIFYDIMKRYKGYKSNLLAMIKLITIPITYRDEICVSCEQIYHDIVYHCIVECNTHMQIRNDLWDVITDVLDVHSSVELFNTTDEQIIEILLGKPWHHLSDREHADAFYTQISTIIVKFIPNICKNLPWYRM